MEKFNFKNYIDKQKRYFLFDIWFKDYSQMPKFKRYLIVIYKILVTAIKKFLKDKCDERASSLSYYSIMAVVPILALAFGIALGFGFDNVLENSLKNLLSTDTIMWTKIIEFAQNMLQKTNSSLIASVGVAVLIWIIMTVITEIESVMNSVWEVKKPRSIIRKFTDYTTIIMITPMLLFAAISARIYISNHIDDIVDINFLQSCVQFAIAMTPYIASYIILCILYIIMPNTRTPIIPILIATAFSCAIFLIMQMLYVRFQIYMTSYNAIYGSFAAIPLFLIWLRIAWFIILFGAELAFAIQNKDKYIYEADYRHLNMFRKKIYALYILKLLIEGFKNKQGGMSINSLAVKIGIPKLYVLDIVECLTKTNIISKIHKDNYKDIYDILYQPAYDINDINIADILIALDMYEHDYNFEIINKKEYHFFETQVVSIQNSIREAKANKYIKDISTE